jgi:hypothetical protein
MFNGRLKAGFSKLSCTSQDGTGGVRSGVPRALLIRHHMERHESGRISATLATRVGDDADPTQIADAIISTWDAVNDALSPIIGRGGVAALYNRSLHLTGLDYPWLADVSRGAQTTMDLVGLKAALSRQTSANATAGGTAVLQTFYELLCRLVGPSLTDRLLRSTWAPF